MKKVLSILLAAVMLACCMPFAVLADDPTVHHFIESDFFTASDQLQSGHTYYIDDGVKMTVPSNFTLFIPANARLEVTEGGTLDVKGSIVVMKSGSLYCYGTLNGSANIQLNTDPLGAGEITPAAMVQIRFPDLNSDEVKLLGKLRVWYAYGDGSYEQVPDGGDDVFVPVNTRLKIRAHILEPHELDVSLPKRDKYDDAKMALQLHDKNDIPFEYVKEVDNETNCDGYFTIVTSTAGDIRYANWDNENTFLTIKRIVFSSGEGYECVPAAAQDQLMKTEDGTLCVKYGQPFSFKVELDEAYDMSSYEVYIYNGYGWLNLKTTGEASSLSLMEIEAEPDANGYYNIPAVTGDLTISVRGVMKNSTINLIGSLLDTFKNIFNMLKEFFEGMKDLFGGLGG